MNKRDDYMPAKRKKPYVVRTLSSHSKSFRIVCTDEGYVVEEKIGEDLVGDAVWGLTVYDSSDFVQAVGTHFDRRTRGATPPYPRDEGR